MTPREVAEKALVFLSSTDEEVVNLEGAYRDAERKYKETFNSVLLYSDGKSGEIRKAQAETHESTKAAWVESHNAWMAWRKLATKRERATQRWDDWRSLNSARKQGVI